MKTARAHARASISAPRERSLRSRRPAFALEPPAEVPDLDKQMDRAVRFGHRLETFAAGSPAAGFGEAVQRVKTEDDSEDSLEDSQESSSEEQDDDDDDEEFFLQERTSKSKKQDPKSTMKKDTYKTMDTGFEYETEGGSKHSESFDPKKLFRKSKTTGVSLTGPDFRNNASRDNVELQVFNPYGLSQGQNTLNQSVVSHNTPSWLSMRAGGKYGNSSETSGFFNSGVEQKEKKWRSELQGSKKTFDYETETQYEKISENPRYEEIANLMTNKKWKNPERIKKRLTMINKLNPNAVRVLKEKRTLSGDKTRTMTLGTDLHYGIPRRAFDKKAHKKYVDKRGQDSESSDLELESSKKLKKKVKSDKN